MKNSSAHTNDRFPRAADAKLQQAILSHEMTVSTGIRGAGKHTLAQAVPGVMVVDDPKFLDIAAAHTTSSLPRPNGKILLITNIDITRRSDSFQRLGDRAAHVVIHPMTRREQLGLGCTGIWQSLLQSPESEWLDIIESGSADGEDWRELAQRGGLPVAAIEIDNKRERAVWFDELIDLVIADARRVSNVSATADLKRLLAAAISRPGRMLNRSEVARDVGVAQPTAYRHLDLLLDSHLIVELPGFSSRGAGRRRTIVAPKVYAGDCGLAVHMSGNQDLHVEHLKNIVLLDLLAFAHAGTDPATVSYWRTASSREIDFVFNWNDQLLPLDVKSNPPSASDLASMIVFREEHPESRAGVVLHDGTHTGWIAPGILCAPWWKII